jgi:AcrR family transcriptional regulator
MVQRETIIEQAAKMFAEQGIKSIRMDDIAQSLGVSKRTLYEMVEDKEELLYLSIRYMQSRRMAKVEQKLRENTESLVQLFDSFALMTENRELHRRISSNLRKFYPATFERLRKEAEAESGKILFSLIQHYIDCGLIVPTVDIRLSVTILYYTTTTIVTSADNMTLPDGVTVNDALAYTIINFFRGIATIKGVQQIDDYLESKRKNSNNI